MKVRISCCYIMILIILFCMMSLTAQTVLITEGANWAYYEQIDAVGNQLVPQDASEPPLDDDGDEWMEYDYDIEDNDFYWNSGPAELGYGDGDESTVLSYGPDVDDKYISYYFIHEFNVVNPNEYSYLKLRLKHDDGAVIYLNDNETINNELLRSFMPAGNVEYTTTATSGADEDIFYEFYFDCPSYLVAGVNVIAVEVHQYHEESSDISLDLELVLTNDPPPVTRKAPYLIHNGNNTQMIINWQTFEALDAEIYLYDDVTQTNLLPNYPITVTQYIDDFKYKKELDNLTPGQMYYYVVEISDQEFSGSFRALPASNASSIRFFAYGDTRTYPLDHDAIAEKIYHTYVDEDPTNPNNVYYPEMQSMILHVGDLVNAGEDEEDWDDEFFDPSYTYIQKMLATMPLQAVRGNHEEVEDAGELYQKYFPYPTEVQGNYDSNYWSYDYGPAHFIHIDQYEDDEDGTLSDTQLAWIENELSSTNKDWKFLVLHEPGWTANGSNGYNMSIKNEVQPLCLKYGVQAIFAGHKHYYARNEVNGIQHVTTGGGGANLYTPDLDSPYLEVGLQIYQFSKIEIVDDVLTFQCIDVDGDVRDTFTLTLYDQNDYNVVIDDVADFIIGLQDQDSGAIPDWPEGPYINKDSTMEYALIGLAAAYKETNNSTYLEALEKGISWLASKQTMSRNDIDSTNPVDWYGSWYYGYDSDGEFLTDFGPDEIGVINQRAPDPERNGIYNIRGVDTTCALFVYLVYLHYVITGDKSLAIEYALNARAACDFLIYNSIDSPDNIGYTYSSWSRETSYGKWERYDIMYTADQADVYLGLRAGSLLFPQETGYVDAADFLQQNVCTEANENDIDAGFFNVDQNYPYLNHYWACKFEDGSYATAWDEANKFSGTFAQGYLPWVFGDNGYNETAFNWITGDENWNVFFNPAWSTNPYYLYFDFLQSTGASDDLNYLDYSPMIQYVNPGLSYEINDDVFSLSAILHFIAADALEETLPYESLNWLINSRYDDDESTMYGDDNGGIYDCLYIDDVDIDFEETKYTNVAGFTLMALTEFDNMLDEIPIVNDITTGTTNWDTPLLIANNLTVDTGATLNIESDRNVSSISGHFSSLILFIITSLSFRYFRVY